MVSILPALREVRKDLAGLLERRTVDRICRELNHAWRKRQLDPYTTLHLFILQVVHQNTAMTHLPHVSDAHFSASAYCQARRRMPLALLQRVVNTFTQRLATPDGAGLWRGHRVALIDGSGFSMPDTPELQAHFGQPVGQRPGCGFPVAHLLALIDAHTGYLYDAIVSPLRTHDLAHAAELHPRLSTGDIVVADRGFCSYAHLALICRMKLHAVLRVHQRTIVDFHPYRLSKPEIDGTGIPTSRWLKRLGHCDQLVEWRKPQAVPKWMPAEQHAALPDKLVVREIKWRVRVPGRRVREVTLVTTLLDAEQYPAEAIAKLYERRWQVEVDLRDLKNTLGLDVLKGKKLDTVLKEVQIYVLVYNLVRLVIVRAAERQHVQPHRISFIDALRWLQPTGPVRGLRDLVTNPLRPKRIEPRCRKRRPKQYPRMTRPRAELQKHLKKRRNAA